MNKKKVLLIDDDILLGKILVEGLQTKGYDAEFSSTLCGLSALVQDYNPDIIFLDYEMKNTNSMTIMPELKFMRPNIPIVFMSSYADAQYQKEAIEAGAENYLKKPITATILDIYIKKYLGESYPNLELKFGTFTLNTKDRQLKSQNDTIHQLSNYEYRILTLLSIRKGTIVTLKELQQTVWENNYEVASKSSLYNYIAKLRKMLKSDTSVEIKSISKLGYKLITK